MTLVSLRPAGFSVTRKELYARGLKPYQAMKLLRVLVAEHEAVERQPEEVAASSCGSIHIEVPGEVWISVEAQADSAMIRAVLEGLRS